MDGEKEYEATLKLGVETDTFDLEGKITASRPVGELDRARVEKCVSGFEGIRASLFIIMPGRELRLPASPGESRFGK